VASGRGAEVGVKFRELPYFLREARERGFPLPLTERLYEYLVATSLREHPAQTSRPAQSLKYLTDGESLFVITDDRQKILDAMERQFVLSLGIGNLVRELNGEVERAARGPERKGGRGLGRLREKGSGTA